MDRKATYIRAWRRHRGHTLADMVGRLAELGVATTEATLSRIETGKLPYGQDMLEALAAALSVETDQLLSHDPEKEGRVIDFLSHLDTKQAAQAEAVLRAMFGEKTAS